MMKLTFLGSGCWQGIPAPFGDDKISKKVKWGSKDFRFRTSLLITTANNKKILVEITPDIRLQSWKFMFGKPDAILVSHWHWDHFFGLMDIAWFAERNNILVYGSSATKQWYDLRMAHIPIDFRIFNSYDSFEIDNVKITPIKVNHVEGTDGFLFKDKDTGKKVAYLPDFSSIPERTLSLTNGAVSIIMDATYLESNINDDPTHLQKDQFVPFMSKLKTKDIIFSGIGSYQGLKHTNLEKKFPQCTIAYDGMRRRY